MNMPHVLSPHVMRIVASSRHKFITRITHLDAITWFLTATLSLGSLWEIFHSKDYMPNDFLPKEYIAYHTIPYITFTFSTILTLFGSYAFLIGKKYCKARWLEGQILLWMYMILVHLSVLPMNVSVGFYGVFLGMALASHKQEI